MVKIEWIRHHNPDLVVEDDDGRKRTLDLSMYSYKQLHALFQAEFKPPTSVVPVNNATVWHRESASAATPLLKYDAGLPNPHSVRDYARWGWTLNWMDACKCSPRRPSSPSSPQVAALIQKALPAYTVTYESSGY